MRLLPVLLLVLAPPALAAADPERQLTDPEGDCAVPYGNAYLDVTGAWVENETPATFDVVLEISAYDDALAEGSGFAVQFEHQGLRWGIVAYRSLAAGEADWTFRTGQATAERVDPAGFQETPGAFLPGPPPRLVATFPKPIFPHTDPDDHVLRGFWAASVDLRPAYPFMATGQDPNGKWVVCDEARGAGAYEFREGRHAEATAAHAHDAPQSGAPPGPVAAQASGDAPAASGDVAPARAEAPLPALPVALCALAAVAIGRSRVRGS